MECPKCKSDMEKVKHGGIEVDRCTNCKGIWFDLLEEEDLKKIEGSESIDIGDEQVGKSTVICERLIAPFVTLI